MNGPRVMCALGAAALAAGLALGALAPRTALAAPAAENGGLERLLAPEAARQVRPEVLELLRRLDPDAPRLLKKLGKDGTQAEPVKLN